MLCIRLGLLAIRRSEERPSLDGLWLANIASSARLRLSVSMIVAARSGLRPLRAATIMDAKRHSGTAQSSRSDRSEA
jgi:hypothetical protein